MAHDHYNSHNRMTPGNWEHYDSNNGWAAPGNWELSGDGRFRGDGGPRPAAPALNAPSPATKRREPAVRPVGSVDWNKKAVLGPVTKSHNAVAVAHAFDSAPTMESSASRSKHRVFRSLQRDKLLMGGERELSQANIMITVLLVLLALMQLNWHLAVVAVLFGGPVQWAIRHFSEQDPDYIKTYLEGLSCPHIREPE
jgi:type IV secretory pathway TrbD component